jgi:ElaB/YqjD/DUF883 family membrane-anchored ribosome-binding protein
MEKVKESENRLRDLSDQVVPQWEKAEEKFKEANRRILGFVKERPGTCLLGGLAVGFLFGRVVRTRG